MSMAAPCQLSRPQCRDIVKVLFLTLNYAPSVGGNQIHVREIAERLVRSHGHEVEVWTSDSVHNPAFSPGGDLPSGPETLGGLTVRRFRYSSAYRRLVRAAQRATTRAHLPRSDLLGLLRRGPLSIRMAAKLITTRADVVVTVPFDYLHMYYPIAARLLGKQLAIVQMGTLHLSDRAIPRHVGRAIVASDRYVALTQAESDAVVASGMPPEAIAVIPPGVDPPRHDANAERFRLAHRLGSDPVVAFLGRHTRYKGIVSLVDAMEELWREARSYDLVIAGATSEYSSVVRARLAALPEAMRSRVRLVDNIDELSKAELLATADLLVNTSTQESYGIVFLEAWAAATPVIGADTPVVREVVGEAGCVVPHQNTPALSQAIECLLEDATRRKAAGLAGRQRVRTQHGWDDIAGQWNETLIAARAHR